MAKTTRLSLEEIAEYFGELEDPRSSKDSQVPKKGTVRVFGGHIIQMR